MESVNYQKYERILQLVKASNKKLNSFQAQKIASDLWKKTLHDIAEYKANGN